VPPAAVPAAHICHGAGPDRPHRRSSSSPRKQPTAMVAEPAGRRRPTGRPTDRPGKRRGTGGGGGRILTDVMIDVTIISAGRPLSLPRLHPSQQPVIYAQAVYISNAKYTVACRSLSWLVACSGTKDGRPHDARNRVTSVPEPVFQLSSLFMSSRPAQSASTTVVVVAWNNSPSLSLVIHAAQNQDTAAQPTVDFAS